MGMGSSLGRDHRPERGLGCTGAPYGLCTVGAEIHHWALDAVLTVPCVLVKGEPGDDGKPGRQGIPGSPGEKVGEMPVHEHPLPSVSGRGPLIQPWL